MSDKELKLNIGCGYTNLPENWINIDSSFSALLAKYPKIKKLLYIIKILPKRLYDLPWPKNISVLDVSKRLPCKDCTVKYIYSSHFLEHISKKDAEYFITECYRVMNKGGVIRIIVPDLQSGIKSYIEQMEHITKFENRKNDVPPADEFIEGLGLYDSTGKNDSSLIKLIRILQGNKNKHKWMYDCYSLSLKLKQAGFTKVTQKQYLESRIEDINLLDNHYRFDASICIEAVKS